MKSSIRKYIIPIGFGLALLIITTLGLVSATFTGCIKQDPGSSSSGGCGTTMGCCPATGCGTGWYGASTGLCYPTSSSCLTGGNSNCRQCY